MVKSRRRASAAKSRPNATVAWRPSVATSAAQRRHLDRLAVDDHRHRAVREAGRRDAEAGRARALHHDFGQGGGGEVEIARLLAQREVAHRAADQARLLALAVERPAARARAGLRRAGADRRGVRREWRRGRSLEMSGHQRAVFDMGRHVDALAARRGRNQHDHSDQRRRQAEEDQRRRPGCASNARPPADSAGARTR